MAEYHGDITMNSGILTVQNTGLHILDTNGSHDLIIAPGSDLTADRTLTVTTGDAARGLTLSGDLTVESASLINQDLTTDASPTFAGATLSGDTFISNGSGLVVGHSSQITALSVNEFQVLGTSAADSSITLARFDANANSAGISIVKSRSATIGSNAIVQNNDEIGGISFFADDGTDYNTRVAFFEVEVDDSSPAVNDIGAAFVFSSLPGGGDTSINEVFRIAADATVSTQGNINMAASTALQVNSTAILSDSSGTMTLSNVDALDATTEATIEAAIDTLANLTSVQGQTVSLSGALTVESASLINQDLTTDATPTFAGLNLSAYTRRMKFSVDSVGMGVTAPAAVDRATFHVLAFDADAETAFIEVRVPEDWDAASDMTLVVEWTNESGTAIADTETVKWDISFRSRATGEAYDGGTVATATTTYTQSGAGTDKEIIVTNITIDFDNANQPLTAGDLLGISFNRDFSTDTYAADAEVLNWFISYSSNDIPVLS